MKQQVEFDFDEIAQTRVDAMRVASGAKSFGVLMAKALALYDDVFHHMKRGGLVILRDRDGVESSLDREGITLPSKDSARHENENET